MCLCLSGKAFGGQQKPDLYNGVINACFPRITDPSPKFIEINKNLPAKSFKLMSFKVNVFSRVKLTNNTTFFETISQTRQ